MFGTLSPTVAQITSKFGHRALVEPVVAGQEQVDDFSKGTADAFPLSNCRSPTCMSLNMTDPLSCDINDCDQPSGWSDALEGTAVNRLMNVATLAAALGVDPRSIEWLKASSRTRAYGRNDGTLVQSPTDMINTFGTLGVGDSYFVLQNDAVLDGYPGSTKWFSAGAGLTSATDYVTHIRNGVSTFVTTADFDANVHSPAIPYAIAFFRQNNATFSNLVSSLNYQKTDITGLARPGDSFINYADGTQRQVYMPFSYASGHTVVMRQPGRARLPTGRFVPAMWVCSYFVGST